MNILDILFIVILLISTIMGLFRGATQEIFSLGAIVCGVLGASRLYPKLTPYLAKYISNPVLANLLSFVIIFLVIAGALMLISIILCKIWKILLLGWADRVGGALFGFVRGVVLIGIICALLSIFPLEKTREMMKNSNLLPSLEPIKEVLFSLFPFERILPNTKSHSNVTKVGFVTDSFNILFSMPSVVLSLPPCYHFECNLV